jgi:predicted metal-dependent hydrolase
LRPFVQLVLDLFEPQGAQLKKEGPVAGSPAGESAQHQPQLNPNSPRRISADTQGGNLTHAADSNEGLSRDLVHDSLQSGYEVAEQGAAQIGEDASNLFRHPNAKRVIVLQNTQIAYAFRRAKRKTIGMSVSFDGLTVSAPRWVGWTEIEAALHERGEWIVRKIVEMQERQKFLSKRKLIWAHAATFPLLGVEVQIVLDPSHSFQKVGGSLMGRDRRPLAKLQDVHAGCQLYLCLPQSAQSMQIQDSVQSWLMRQAKSLFEERLNWFAPQLSVQWTKLSLSSANTRWGSASSDGSIRLNWRLIHFKMDVIDYVVAHELSHLRVMDHSPRFWDTVKEVVPDFKARRAVLNDKSAPIWS